MKHFNPNIEYIALFISFLFILFPFLALSIFTHPVSDDFWFANITKEYGWLGAQKWWYNNYSGRFFSNAIISLNPITFDNFTAYKFYPVTILGLLFYSLYYLFRSVFPHYLKSKNLLLVLIFATVELLMFPSTQETIYWIPGGITYLFSIVLIHFFLAFLFTHFAIGENKSNNSKLLVLSVCIIGSCEPAMVFILFVWSCILAYKIWTKKQLTTFNFIILGISLLAATVVILASGNSVRALDNASHPSKSMFAVFGSPQLLLNVLLNNFTTEYTLLIHWLSSKSILLLFSTLIFILFPFKKTNPAYSRLPNPFYFLVLVFVLLFFMILPWTVGMGVEGIHENLSGRFSDFTFLFFMLAWFVFILSLHKFTNHVVVLKIEHYQQKLFLLSVSALLVVIIFTTNNIRNAYSDLLTGRAYRFDKEQINRYNRIKNSTSDSITIAPFSKFPTTIYTHDDISTEKGKENGSYKVYFHKKSIHF